MKEEIKVRSWRNKFRGNVNHGAKSFANTPCYIYETQSRSGCINTDVSNKWPQSGSGLASLPYHSQNLISSSSLLSVALQPFVGLGLFGILRQPFLSLASILPFLTPAFLMSLFVFGATVPSGSGSPHSRGFWITHNDAPQSIELLWTSDQLAEETST